MVSKVNEEQIAFASFLRFVQAEVDVVLQHGGQTAEGYKPESPISEDEVMKIQELAQQHWDTAVELVGENQVESWWEQWQGILLPPFCSDVSPNG